MEFRYKGLEATLERVEVTEEEIDRQLKRLDGQDTSEYTPEELRQGVADTLRAYYDARAEEELMDKLLRQAAATLDYRPEAAEIERGAQAQMETLKAQLAQRELTLEAYCQFMNTTEAQILEDVRIDAEQLLKIQKTIEKIAELEKVTVEEADVKAMCEEICRQNQLSSQELQELYDEDFARAVHESVISAKVQKILRENAKITELSL